MRPPLAIARHEIAELLCVFWVFLEPGKEMERRLLAELEGAISGIGWISEINFAEVGMELTERGAGAVITD